MASSTPHSTLTTPFSIRAGTLHTPPLASYLLSLISIKRSNLCVSADVHTTAELLRVAEEVGNHICILKTHADIIDDWSNNTIARLQEVATRKHFLLFEDRKFGDIGNTLQLQYTRGPLRIASWAHLTNAHLLPGPSIVPTLHAAAQAHLISLNQSVSTEISAGPPLPEDTDHDDEGEGDSSTPPSSSHTTVTTATTTSRDFANERNPMTTEATTTQPPLPAPGPAASSQSDSNDINEDTSDHMLRTHRRNRSGSAFATTTITQSSEPLSPHKPPPSLMKTLSQNEEEDEEPAGEVPSSSSSLSSARNDGIHISGTATTKPLSSQASYIPSTHLLKDLGPPPHARGLLLLAQMSSEGNLATTSYTQACVSTAQANRDFVLGFISQRSLNSAEADNFLCMAPGVSLPSEAEEREREAAAATAATPIKGDGLGQQWRDPKEVVGRDGIDVVIVGRGILSAEDRGREAERYRRKAWEAYEARIGRRGRLAD